MATNVFYAHSLQLEIIGRLALVNSIGIIAAVLIDRGMGTWITRSVPSGLTDIRGAADLLLRGALAPVALLTALASFAFLMAGAGDGRAVIVSSLVLALSYWWFSAGVSLAQAAGDSSARAIGIAANGVLTLIATAGSLSLSPTFSSALGASVAAYLAVATWLWWRAASSRNLEALPPAYGSADALKESRPLFGANVLTFALTSGDVIVASTLLPASTVGQYQIAKKVAQAAVLPLIATLPMAMNRMASRTNAAREKLLCQLGDAAAVLLFVASLGSAVLLPTLLPVVFGADFGGLTTVTVLLLATFQLQYFRDLVTVATTASGQFHRALWANGASVLTLALLAAATHELPISLEEFCLILAAAYAAGLSVHFWHLRNAKDWTAGTRRHILTAASASCIGIAVVGFIS